MSSYNYGNYTNDFSNKIYSDLSEIRNETGVFKKITVKVCKFIAQNLFNLEIEQKRNDFALLSQEHLLQDVGSYVSDQKKLFFSLLSNKKSPSFNQLNKEMLSLEERKGMFWPRMTSRAVDKLKEGESIWLDFSVVGHTMLARITKEGGSFTLQYANTGMGINNSQFHPQHLSADGVLFFQTVAVIKGISKEQLSTDFFNRINTFGKEKGAKGVEKIYSQLSQLGVPQTIPYEENSPYWSEPQIGGSCSPSALWALTKVVLPSKELKLLEHESGMRSLLRNYRHIKIGWDETATTKIMVLDQIQKLKGINKTSEVHHSPILDLIENDFLSDLAIKSPEVKITSRYQGIIPSNPSKNKNLEIQPKQAFFYQKKESLDSRVLLNKTDEFTIPYSFTSDDNGEVKGKNLSDTCYLLYLSIATGNQEAVNDYLGQVMALMENIPQISPDKMAFFGSNEKLVQTTLLFFDLAEQLIKLDRTRSGVAKAFFCVTLPHTLLSLNGLTVNEEIRASENNIKFHYRNLHVKNYLSSENIWVQNLEKLDSL